MRQETGSNLTIDNKKVSIQVKLGGLSFSAESVTATDRAEHVEFVIDTPRVILAPREAVSLDTASALLRLAGKPCHLSELSVCSELQADIVAIMAIDHEALTSMIEKWGSRASFTSPLLDMRHNDEQCLTIDWRGEVCYMHLFDGGLQRAESFVMTSADDLLYNVVEWLGERELPIYIKGERKVAKLLAKYFERVVCE